MLKLIVFNILTTPSFICCNYNRRASYATIF